MNSLSYPYHLKHKFSMPSDGVRSVIVYKPDIILKQAHCPQCTKPGLEETRMYSDGQNVKYKPRLLYGVSENTLLVSQIFKCFHWSKYILGKVYGLEFTFKSKQLC